MTPATENLPGPCELARFIDHTLLRADATREAVAQLCAEAREHGFGCVCVNGSRVAQAHHFLEGSAVHVTAAIGFPLGATDADVKRYETEAAIDGDAHVIEVVANVGRLKDGDHAYVLRELRDIVEAADERPVSVVVEAPLLSRQELEIVCRLAVDAGVKAIVTSTGFEGRNAGVEDVAAIKEFCGNQTGIKASGGIGDLVVVRRLIEVGATRIGSTESVAIIASARVGSV